MELTKKFNQLNKHDSSIAGGKGASLGEMLNAGIPVPDGFVVLSTTFDEFIKKAGLEGEIDSILGTVDHKAVHTIDGASEKIQELIKHADMPEDIAKEIFSQFDTLGAEYVAVRSSATAEDGADHAWAGQLDSYLNTTRKNVLKKVKDCWASLFTPRAIFYRFEKGLHTTAISVAVVVQKMVNSEISGIVFSVHPVTEDRNQLIIEAGFGLGEAIVSGSVTPDSYVVEKNPRRIIDITVNHQNKALYRKEGGGNEWTELADQKADAQILAEDHINELSNIILTIENHYGFPCDIEWAFEGGKFYIVQSRPITTLSVTKHDLGDASNHKALPWYHWGRWVGNTLFHSLWFMYPHTKIVKKFSIFNIKGFKLLDGNYYLSQNDLDVLSSYIKEKYDHDIEWFDSFFLTCESAVKELNNCKDRKESLEVFSEKLYEALACSLIIEWMDYATQSYIKEKALLLNYDSDEIFRSIRSSKPTLMMEFIEKINSSRFSNEEILTEYEWVGTHGFEGSPLTNEKIEELRDTVSVTVTVPTIYAPSNFQEVLTIASNLAYYRSYIVETGNKISYLYWKDIQAKARTYGFTWKEITYCSIEEMLNLKNKVISLDVINKRREGFGILLEEDGIKVITGGELFEDLEKTKERVDFKNAKTVSGHSAYKGIVRGIAKIIEHANEIAKFNRGDVLVANETTPDFIVIMKMASAIVTNTGGITSHAAIVARELGKPCIIGTKFATQILKDGDTIEVDASSGIIKIID